MNIHSFQKLSMDNKVKKLYLEGEYIMSIRYYRHKINLYLLEGHYIEVYYNHRRACVDKIDLLDLNHKRMKWYLDQIKVPNGLFNR